MLEVAFWCAIVWFGWSLSDSLQRIADSMDKDRQDYV